MTTTEGEIDNNGEQVESKDCRKSSLQKTAKRASEVKDTAHGPGFFCFSLRID